jgi:hypothetical protein
MKGSYRFLEWVIVWKVDDYVDWNKEQKPEFDQRLIRLLKWHDSQQLPLYSELLQQFKGDVSAPLSEQQLVNYIDQAYDFWQQIMVKASPDLSFMLKQLSDNQVDQFLSAIDKDIAKDEERFLSRTEEESQKRRVRKFEKLLVRFVGGLTQEQKLLIDQWSVVKTSTTQSRLAYRKQWRIYLDEALKKRGEDGFDDLVDALFVYPDQWWSDKLRQDLDANKSEIANLLMNLQVSLTQKQRDHLSRELDEWSSTFDNFSLRYLDCSINECES